MKGIRFLNHTTHVSTFFPISAKYVEKNTYVFFYGLSYFLQSLFRNILFFKRTDLKNRSVYRVLEIVIIGFISKIEGIVHFSHNQSLVDSGISSLFLFYKKLVLKVFFDFVNLFLAQKFLT